MQGTIWVGSYFGGVNYFTPKQDSFVHYDYDQNATKNQYYSYIGDIVVDKNRRRRNQLYRQELEHYPSVYGRRQKFNPPQ